MGDGSKIEWTDATWNPVTGCTKVSPGCDHCYAETFAERFRGKAGHHFERGFDLTLRPERLDQPLRWTKPRRIFVNSMSDLFHDSVPDRFIAEVFAVMALSPQHTYQLLTKRHGRMRSLLAGGFTDSGYFGWQVKDAMWELVGRSKEAGAAWRALAGDTGWWPLRNLWLGVSVENQRWADIRIPALLDTPAAVRWISAEPLLGPVDLRKGRYAMPPGGEVEGASLDGIGWVVVGGESGHGARPMHPDWARFLRDQCTAAGVPFLFKQWGEHVPAAVEDAPTFSGGRAWRHPFGGTYAATIRDRSTKAFHSGATRPMEPGDRNGHGVMLDRDTIAVRVGKAKAGRDLDGRTWDEYPDGPR